MGLAALVTRVLIQPRFSLEYEKLNWDLNAVLSLEGSYELLITPKGRDDMNRFY